MIVTERKRKALIRANANLSRADGDILPGDWVQLVTGGPVGWVKSITKGHAEVIWLGGNMEHDCALLFGLLVRVDHNG